MSNPMSMSSRAALVLLGVLSAGDLALPLLSDGEHPPMAEALIVAAIGLASLVLVVSAWRGARHALIALVVLRVLAAATAVPALVIPGVPTVLVAMASTAIALNVLGIGLLLAGARRSTVRTGAR